MKKLLFFSILIFSLSACDKFDDTPKCDDADVVEIAKDLNKVKNYFSADLNIKIFQEYTGKRISDFEQGTQEFEKANDLYRNINVYLEQYIFDKNENEIPEDILPIIKKVVSQYDVPSSLYDIPSLSNIRIVSTDRETKSCSCEGDLNYSNLNNQNKSKPIFYTAQKNTDGETYVKVLK